MPWKPLLLLLWLGLGQGCGETASEEPGASSPGDSGEGAGAGDVREDPLAEDPVAGLEELRAIGYTQWEDAGDDRRVGVTLWDEQRAWPGYHLFTNDQDEAWLMSMGGRIVHTWRFGDRRRCEYVHLRDDGSVVAVFVGREVAAFSWDSTLLWSRPIRAHHDVAEAPDRSLWVPYFMNFRQYQGRKVVFDGLVHLSADGEVLERWKSFEHLEDLQRHHRVSGLDEETPRATDQSYSYYHLNSVQVLPDTELGRTDRRFRAGNLMVNLRNANVIVILDPETWEVLWSYGPDVLDLAHMPRMLPDGRILVFDNGTKRRWSRVLELDPRTKEVVWEYQAEPREAFFSMWQGGAQRLANGNTLICEATRGRVFEVTPEGETVWEFFHRLDQGRRKTVYRMRRVDAALVEPLLGR